MKKEAISKINKMGKIGQICSIIANSLITLGMIVVVVSMVLCAVLPKDLVEINWNTSIDVGVNQENIGKNLLEKDKEAVLKEFNSTGKEDLVDGLKDSGISELGDASKFEDKVDFNVEDIEVEKDRVYLKSAMATVSFQLGDFIVLLSVVLAELFMIFVIIWFICRLCKAVRYCESPFEEKVIKSIQHIAISLIPWFIVSGLSNAYVNHVFKNGSNNLFELDLGKLAIILVIFALAYVFKYGAVLQQESDETL